MATYGYSTPYMGQRQPTLPPGYMEAATAPGRNIAAGIQQFAAGLGQTIQRYQANKAETEAALQTFETLSGMTQQALAADPQYQAIQQYYETGQLPAGVTENDLKRFETKVQADRSMLNKMAGIGEKFGDMSLAKKKAAIGDMAMVLGQYQNRATEDLKRKQLEIQVGEAERAVKQRESEQQAMRALGQIPTEVPQFQPLPMVEAGDAPIEMQPVQQLPPIQRTPEEIRQSARNVFGQFGVTNPQAEALDKLLIAAGKLPRVSTQAIPGVGTLVNVGGEDKLVEAKQPSFTDITKQKALTIDYPEFKGMAPTEKEAADFREQYSNVDQSRKNIGRLIEIAQMGKIAQQDPRIKSEAEQLARAAQGALRLDIIGPGTVTDRDRALLESIVRNPTDIFSLQSSNIKSLNSLLERAGGGLQSKAKALGLEVGQPEQSKQQSPLATDPRVSAIRARFQAGKISRQQAEQELRSIQ